MIVKIQTVPDRGVGAEGLVRVFRHYMVAIFSDYFQILVQTFMRIRLLKVTVQFQNVMNEYIYLGDALKLLRTKIWKWYDINLLK